jgi:hypothetical protein
MKRLLIVLDRKGILSGRTVVETEISVDQKLGRNEFLHGSPAPRIKLQTYTTPAIEKGGYFSSIVITPAQNSWGGCC